MTTPRRCCALSALHGFFSGLFDTRDPARCRRALHPFRRTPLPEALGDLRAVAALSSAEDSAEIDRFLGAAVDAVARHALTWEDVIACTGPCAHGAMTWSLAS